VEYATNHTTEKCWYGEPQRRARPAQPPSSQLSPRHQQWRAQRQLGLESQSDSLLSSGYSQSQPTWELQPAPRQETRSELQFHEQNQPLHTLNPQAAPFPGTGGFYQHYQEHSKHSQEQYYQHSQEGQHQYPWQEQCPIYPQGHDQYNPHQYHLPPPSNGYHLPLLSFPNPPQGSFPGPSNGYR
jgi:hypothetical protein